MVGDRYVHVGRDPSGGSKAEVRVLRWDPLERTVREEPAVGEGAVLTWDHDGDSGAIRLRVNPERGNAIAGYLAGGALDSMTVVVEPSVIRVMSGGSTLAEFADNVLAGSAVGLRIDPANGGISFGGLLPDGFDYKLTYISRIIRLGLMVDVNSPILSNREFIDCRVEGPALLAPVGPFTLEGNRMGGRGVDQGSLVWEIPPTGQPFGALVASNVRFLRCDLLAIAFAVAQGQREIFLGRLFGR